MPSVKASRIGLTGRVSQQRHTGLPQGAGLGGARRPSLWRRGKSQACSEEEAVTSCQEVDQGRLLWSRCHLGGAWKDGSRTFPFPINSVSRGLLRMFQVVRQWLCRGSPCRGLGGESPTLHPLGVLAREGPGRRVADSPFLLGRLGDNRVMFWG